MKHSKVPLRKGTSFHFYLREKLNIHPRDMGGVLFAMQDSSFDCIMDSWADDCAKLICGLKIDEL